MAGLLVAMTVMAISLTVLLPAWRTMAQREKEAELIFRGEQYARAINLFQRRYANASPPDIDTLVNQRFLRKKYKDPITGGDFQVLTAGANQPGPAPGGAPATGRGGAPSAQQAQAEMRGALEQVQRQFEGGVGSTGRGGIVGVMSTSSAKSFRIYNGRDTYNQWVFMGVQQSTRGGGPGGAAGRTGADGRGGRGGADGRGGRQGAPAGGRGAAPPPPPPPPRRF
jgi:type II secretory pathway pseudopilin PulG